MCARLRYLFLRGPLPRASTQGDDLDPLHVEGVPGPDQEAVGAHLVDRVERRGYLHYGGEGPVGGEDPPRALVPYLDLPGREVLPEPDVAVGLHQEPVPGWQVSGKVS